MKGLQENIIIIQKQQIGNKQPQTSQQVVKKRENRMLHRQKKPIKNGRVVNASQLRNTSDQQMHQEHFRDRRQISMLQHQNQHQIDQQFQVGEDGEVEDEGGDAVNQNQMQNQGNYHQQQEQQYNQDNQYNQYIDQQPSHNNRQNKSNSIENSKSNNKRQYSQLVALGLSPGFRQNENQENKVVNNYNNAACNSNNRKRRDIKIEKEELTSLFSDLVVFINNKVCEIQSQLDKNSNPNGNSAKENKQKDSVKAVPRINPVLKHKSKSTKSRRQQEPQFIDQSANLTGSVNGLIINNMNKTSEQSALVRKYSCSAKDKQKDKSIERSQLNNKEMDRGDKQKRKKEIFNNYREIMKYQINQDDSANSLSHTLRANEGDDKQKNRQKQKNKQRQKACETPASKINKNFSVFQQVSLTISPSVARQSN